MSGIGLDVTKSALNNGDSVSFDLPRRRHIAGIDELDHLPDLWSDQVTRHAHGAYGAQADVSERRPIVARVDLEAVRCFRDQPRDTLEVAGRVLDGDDVRSLGETQEGVMLDARRRASGDVVRDDRELRGIGNVLEMCDQAALGWLVVEQCA